ncbi:MAG: glycosyltransferase [Bacteroidota bacterium]
MTRVIHVVSDFCMGGVSAVVFDLVKNYKSSSYEYHIVNLSGGGDEAVINRFRSLGIPIHQVPYSFQSGFSSIDYIKEAFGVGKFRKANKAAIDAIAQLCPDILHFHTLPRELMLGREVKRITNCKLVHTDHLVRLSNKDSSKIGRFLLRLPFQQFFKNYHLIAVSDSVYNYLVNMGVKSTAASITVIRNKIPGSNLRITYSNKPELKVVYVARISYVKGHRDLIQAWSLLPSLGLHLYVVGPDELHGSMQKLYEESNSHNPITFTGSIPNAADFIADADMGVFPSYQEGLPLALLEKMRIGMPCVVSDIPELTSIVSDGVDALVYPSGNIEELSNSIQRLANDLQLREKIGIAAAITVNDKFVSKLGGIDKEYEEFYSTLT